MYRNSLLYILFKRNYINFHEKAPPPPQIFFHPPKSKYENPSLETTRASESVQNTSHTAQSPRRDPFNIQLVVPDGLPLIRENLEDKDLSTAAQNIIMASWRKGTTKQYRSYLLRWTDFCQRENLSPYNPGRTKAIEFLTQLFISEVGYSAINTARSTLSTIILPIAGISFGKDPLLCRFLKGFF